MIRFSLLILATLLAGCATVPLEEPATRARIADSSLPPMKAFGAPRPTAPIQSNTNIAADFLLLHFQLESGRSLPVFTRFETPITVKVTGKPSASLGPDLRQLLNRLRKEAGIDIRQISKATPILRLSLSAALIFAAPYPKLHVSWSPMYPVLQNFGATVASPKPTGH